MDYEEEQELLRRIQEKLDVLDALFAENDRRLSKLRETIAKLELDILMGEIYEYLED